MIESKKNVPYIYKTSRDYKALLKLLDIVTCVSKSDVDNIVSLINPDRCPDKYLPLLASYVGYDYDYNLPYDTNRNIIKYYPNLIRLRGSEDGIRLAAAVAINSSDSRFTIQSASDLVNVNYDKNLGKVMVYMYSVNYLSKLNDLLDVVRPIGLSCSVVSSNAIRRSDKLDIEDTITVDNSYYSVNSFRYRITDYNNAINDRDTENNTVKITISLPMNSGDTLDLSSVKLQMSVYMTYHFKYSYIKYSVVEGEIVQTVEDEYIDDNIIKYINVEYNNDSESPSLVCTSSEPFTCSIGDFPYQLENVFVGVFDSGSVNNNGTLSFTLNLSNEDKGIMNVISIVDATVNYNVTYTYKDENNNTITSTRMMSSKLNNEIGFGQVDDESSFNKES